MKQQIFNVDDFGAVPDGKTDSTKGIHAAIDAAIKSGAEAEVRFGAGEYRIGGPDGQRYGIPVKNARNLTITGVENQTKITVTNQKLNGFKVLGGENVTIRNFIIDYDPLPFTQGTIKAVDFDNGTYDIELDEGYEDFTSRVYEGTNKGFGLPNIVNGLLDSQFGPWAIVATDFKDLGKRTWRVTISDKNYFRNTGLKTGARYVHKMTVWIDAALSSSGCRNIISENVTVCACPGLASMWDNNDKVLIKNFKTAIPDGSGRLLSTNADGIHAFGNRGGMTIDGCSFFGMADDAINIHARSAVVSKIIAPDKVEVITGGTTDCHIGDELMIFNIGTLIEKDRVVAIDVESDLNKQKQIITFNKKVSGLSEGTSYTDIAGDNLFNLSACGQGSIIRNCNFYTFRGRGVLMNTHDITIVDNDFYNVEGWGVSMHNDTTWKEGPPAFDIKIKNNRFHGIGFGHASSVFINSMENPETHIPNKNIKDVLVEGNQFLNIKSSAVGTFGIDGLVIRDNIIKNDSEDRNTSADIRLNHAKNVIISGNRIFDKTSKTTAAVFISENVEKGTGGVIIENNEIVLAEGVPVVQDERK
ncbi:MAG: right-handed parallel beta-helix repeat-containing protein [Saccharofermentanales bacterium]